MPVLTKLVLRLSLVALAITTGCIVAQQSAKPAHAAPNTVACSYPGAPDCNMGGGSMGCCGSSMPSSGCCGSSMPSGCCGSTLPPTTCLSALLCGSQAGLGGCAYGQIFVGGICTAPGQSSSGSACIGSLNTLLSNGCVQSSSGTSPALGSNVPQQSAGTVCINAVTTGCTQGSSAGANNAIPAMNPVGPSQTQPGPSCTYGGNAPPNSQCGECPDGFNTYAPGQSSLCPPGTSCNYGGMVYGANSRCFVCPDGVLTTAMASACPQGTPCSTGIAYAPSTCTQCPGPPANGTAATSSQCPPSTTCPDGSSHWPPYDPCPSPQAANNSATTPAGNGAVAGCQATDASCIQNGGPGLSSDPSAPGPNATASPPPSTSGSASGCGGSPSSAVLAPLMDRLIGGAPSPNLPPFIVPIAPSECSAPLSSSPAPDGPLDGAALSSISGGALPPDATASLAKAASDANNLTQLYNPFSSAKATAFSVDGVLDNLLSSPGNHANLQANQAKIQSLLEQAVESAGDAQSANEDGGEGNAAPAAQAIKQAIALIASSVGADAQAPSGSPSSGP